jgi:murein tripeptide amidase MpaA
MANAHSPTRFNGEADNFFDPNFTLDINSKMRVPKSIRVNGDYAGEKVLGTNGSAWNIASEKFEMHVPDRILVVGKG